MQDLINKVGISEASLMKHQREIIQLKQKQIQSLQEGLKKRDYTEEECKEYMKMQIEYMKNSGIGCVDLIMENTEGMPN